MFAECLVNLFHSEVYSGALCIEMLQISPVIPRTLNDVHSYFGSHDKYSGNRRRSNFMVFARKWSTHPV